MSIHHHSIASIILAAGQGTRMRTKKPKICHEIAGKSMINHVLAAVHNAGIADVFPVVSPSLYDHFDQGKALVDDQYHAICRDFVVQKEQLGTGHAVIEALPSLHASIEKNNVDYDYVLVLFGDTPLIEAETIEGAIEYTRDADLDALVFTFEPNDPTGYGRVIVDEHGLVEKIIEHKDCSSEQLAISVCNGGAMLIRFDMLCHAAKKLDNSNAQNEYYLTDIIEIIGRDLKGKTGYGVIDEDSIMGVNSLAELAVAESIMQNRLRQKFMQNGVVLRDPYSVYFSTETEIAPNSIIDANVHFCGRVVVGEHCHIRGFSHLEDCVIGTNAVIGPFARLRPGADLAEDVKIGNFVEVKKSKLAKGAKVNHLSYIGDSDIGEASNVGAGTITCNYDGFNKHKTVIGKNVFVGSNTSLVAPVTLGDNSLIAAGSTITHDVGDDDLAIARQKQENKKGTAQRLRARAIKQKNN